MLKSNDYLVANVKDKINLAKKRNKIQNTTFLTLPEKNIIKKELKRIKRK